MNSSTRVTSSGYFKKKKQKQPLPIKALYALVVFSASVELFMYAWPADNLIHMVINCLHVSYFIYSAFTIASIVLQSAETAAVAYNTNWYDKDVSMQKKISCMILRSQKLEAIHISGILPTLSLSYYAKVVYQFVYRKLLCSFFFRGEILYGYPSSRGRGGVMWGSHPLKLHGGLLVREPRANGGRTRRRDHTINSLAVPPAA